MDALSKMLTASTAMALLQTWQGQMSVSVYTQSAGKPNSVNIIIRRGIHAQTVRILMHAQRSHPTSMHCIGHRELC